MILMDYKFPSHRRPLGRTAYLPTGLGVRGGGPCEVQVNNFKHDRGSYMVVETVAGAGGHLVKKFEQVQVVITWGSPLNRQMDATENLTFILIRWRVVKMHR